jgi:putative membrane-bound dehydrogenase-like protein
MNAAAKTVGPALLIALALTAAPARGGEVAVDGRQFTLPDGFVLERVAVPPLVDRPIVADFDERGRLYVADSSGSNDKVDRQLAEKPHRVVRLEDTDGDGVFDRRTVFADRMMFPEGAMWLDGSLYVAAPPSIWKLTDTDGDGVADRREEWFQGKTLTGCANDLHGPYAGPDGWVYWCKGAFARQTYERPGKPPFITRAAHIFRCRPDGSGIEPVMTGGMDNPVDVVFTEGGERVFTTTFFQHPGGGQRDGLIHAVYGGIYGKVHDPIFEPAHKWTGPDVMPVLAHLGPAAPCGLTTYQSPAFGEHYRAGVFACCFNLQKVTHHVLRPEGATFAATTDDFLVSAHHDFHPTDVIEDADGSLLVVDTGGWYKLCCPSSQLAKPDVLGAIYRVRKAVAPKVDDPRGQTLDWDKPTLDELAKRLEDPRPAVQRRAVEAFARLGRDGVARLHRVVQAGGFLTARRNAVWAATRIDGPEARAVARSALSDADPTVRQAALHSISLWRDREAVPFLLEILRAESPQMRAHLAHRPLDQFVEGQARHNQRAAAEALGRIGDPSAVPALLAEVGRAADRVMEHSLTYALIEIGDPKALREAMATAGDSEHVRRAALVALDEMDGGGLTPDRVGPALASVDPATRETAAWIVGRHPEWAEALTGFFRQRLGDERLADPDRDALATQLARFARSASVQSLLADRLRDASTPAATRRLVLGAMARSGLKEVPGSWAEGLAEALRSSDTDLVREAVATSRALTPAVGKDRAADLAAALRKVGSDPKAPDAVRVDALAALPGGPAGLSPELFDYLRDRLGPDHPVSVRGAAAGVLGRAVLSAEQLSALIDSIRAVGPLEVERLLGAFERTTDDAIGLKLIAVLRDAPALSALRVDVLKPRLDKYGPRVRREAESLYAALNVDAARQKARLDALLPTLSGGDERRGQAVFNGTKAACSSCHAIGYLGGKVGPDLTKIGQVRTERDLLESILYPSLSFVRSYEPVTVATADGKVVNGVLKKDAPDEVVLAVNANEEAHVPRDQIEELRPGTVSVMPAGLDQQLSPQELADLLAFLKSRK